MTIFYVDATLGDDGWSGEHGTQQNGDGPWQTWDYVRAQSFSAGDTIKFKRGETWTLLANDYWTLSDDGNAENYITIDAYGEGTKPIFDNEIELVGKTWTEEVGEGANIWSTPRTGTIYRCRLDGQDSYTPATAAEVDGITYLWHWNTDDDKLFVYSTQNPNTEYANIKIADSACWVFYMSDCNYIKIQNVRMHGGMRSVRFHATNDESYIEFNDCDIWYGYYGIQCPKTAGGGGTANNITVDGCDIDAQLNLIIKTGVAEGERCVMDGITVQNECDNWTIKNNTITDWGHDGVEMFANASSSQGCNNNIVETNVFDGSSSTYMRAIDISGIDGKCTDNIIRYNVDKNTTVRNQFGGNDNAFYYNLIYSKTEEGVTDKGNISEGLYITKVGASMVCDGNMVYNNIFYGIFNEGISILEAEATNNLIKNNIVMDAGTGGDQLNICINVGSSVGSGNTISNNCFYDADTSDVVNYKGTAETVAEADATRTEFSSNIGSDPAMTNPGSADFTLQVGSPCLNTGTDVSLSTDYAGNSVLALPDIGAYEHQGVEAAPGQNGLHMSMGMGL